MSTPSEPPASQLAGAGQQGGTPEPAECPCRGTGAYTVDIPLADAVVSDLRLCLKHGLRPRARLLDTSTERVGELMDVIQSTRRAWLRPVGGGREWNTDVGSLRPAPNAQ